jgi:tetratricopeptide (TPR) repeat protein
MEEFEKALAGAPASGNRLAATVLRSRKVVLGTLLLTVAVVFLALGPPWRWFGVVDPPPGERPFTVLAAVEGNADEELREAVALQLAIELNKGHPVQTLPEDRVARVRALMDLPDTAVLDRPRARDLATRLGVRAVTLPRLDEFDSVFAFTLSVEDRSSGTQLAGATLRAPSVFELLETVQDAVWEIQESLGETPEALEATGRFPDVVTPSIEALQHYMEGRTLTWMGSPRRAIPLLQDAVTLDSAFAMAWHMLSLAYGRIGMADSAEAAAAQRNRFPERLTDARRANVEFYETRARDVASWDMAYERFEENVVRLVSEGERVTYASNYALALMEISWMDSAYSTALQSHAWDAEYLRPRFPSSVEWFFQCHQVDFLNSTLAAGIRGEMPEYLAFMSDSLGLSNHPECLIWTDFVSSIAEGEWNRADSLFGPLMEAAGAYPEFGNLEYVGENLMLQLGAVRGRVREQHRIRMEGEQGRRALILELAYGLPPGPGEEDGLELAGRGMDEVFRFTLHGTRAALQGDTLEAARVLRRLEAMRDTATSTRFERAFEPWFVLMEAGPAYQAQDWRRLIDILEPLEARFREPGYGFGRGDTYVVWWLLAQAYEEVGRTEDAIARLEDVIGLPRYRGSDVQGLGLPWPAAQLKLGALYGEMGDTARSAEHYRIFLDTFTDPEPEFRWMVEEAEAGLAALGLGGRPR